MPPKSEGARNCAFRRLEADRASRLERLSWCCRAHRVSLIVAHSPSMTMSPMNRRDAIRTMAGAVSFALPATRAAIEPENLSSDAVKGPTMAKSIHLVHCQLGYRPDSPKAITLVADKDAAATLPARVPFFVRGLFDRIPREHEEPAAWNGRYFRWPFDISQGKLRPDKGRILHQGELVRSDTRWGTVWLGDFGAFTKEGIFQVETDV